MDGRVRFGVETIQKHLQAWKLPIQTVFATGQSLDFLSESIRGNFDFSQHGQRRDKFGLQLLVGLKQLQIAKF